MWVEACRSPWRGSDSSSGAPSSSSPTSPRAALCASTDPSSSFRAASFALSARRSYRTSALGEPGEVSEVLLVRGVGGGLRVADRLREGGGEGGLAVVFDGGERLVFFSVSLRDDAYEVGVEAVDKESAHGVAASEDCVAEAAEGVEEGSLPNERRALLVHSRRVAVVGADYVAEEGAGGFAHELVICSHPENYGEVGEGGIAFSEDLPAEADRGSP